MVDPVRLGPVNSITASAPSAEARRSVSPDVSRVSDTPAKSLPRLLDLVTELTQAGPPLDYARIAQLRRAIADGSYTIDADALAKAIAGYAVKD